MMLQLAFWAGSIIALSVLVWAAYYAPAKSLFAVVGSFIGCVVMTFGAYFFILSHPAPMSPLAFSSDEKPVILGSHFQEGDGIFVLMIRAGEREPEYFKLPWDRKMAEELQKALREAETNDTNVEMSWPEENSLERRPGPRFHARPQPAMPEKQPEETEPKQYL